MKDGEQLFLEKVYTSYSKELYDFACKEFCYDKNKADEAMQEMYLIVCMKVDVLYQLQDIEAWLKKVLKNVIKREKFRLYIGKTEDGEYKFYKEIDIDTVSEEKLPMEEMKFYEVSKYLNYLNHELFVGTFCSKTRFWENLPQEQKELVESCLPELAEYIVKVEQDYSQSRLEKIKQNSDIIINEFTEEEREEFKKLSSIGRERYISIVGEEGERLLELLEKDLANAEQKINNNRQ